MECNERGGVVHHRPAHDDPGMHGGAVDGALKDVLREARLVAVVEVNDAEDLVAKPAEAGLDVAPGVVRRSERPVASQPGLHPPCVELVQSVDASAVLGGQGNGAQPVGGVVEELAQAPCGGEGRDGTDQNAAIHLYTHERACPEARSARGRGVSNNARARQRPWISAVSARADSRAA